MEKTTFKKILSVALSIVAVVLFYFIGRILGIEPLEEIGVNLAAIVVGWVIYYAEKWTGLKLDLINNALVKEKVLEGMKWAEGKAIEAFKLDEIITSGLDKAELAIEKITEKLGVNEETAEELVEYYFPQFRPILQDYWKKLAEEAITNAALPTSTEEQS
jgi:hypothetical protein